jgi:hypothetical protein
VITTKIFEYKSPKALGRKAKSSKYSFPNLHDCVWWIRQNNSPTDSDAYKVKTFPNWFMTLVSLYGLGFQLLIIAVMI